MANLNPKLILAPSIQEYFVDKDSGFPLSGGFVTFYKDQARTIKKDIYQLIGSPGDYSYVVLPNPIILSSVGTPQDEDGDDVVIYYYPYEGTPSDDPTSDIVELYYVTVENSGHIAQFTRQAWPNFSTSGDIFGETFVNYIPNDQFLTHNNIPPNPDADTTLGEIVRPLTPVAAGGWYYQRSSSSISQDFITFPRFSGPILTPPANPRYSLNLTCNGADGGNILRDIEIRWNDVNKFLTPNGLEQLYTFSFFGIAALATPVTIILINNFGTGGSATTEQILNTFTIGTSYTNVLVPFVFPVPTAKTIGPNDDDYVALVLRFPTNTGINVTVDTFLMVINSIKLPLSYPYTTNADYLTRAVAGWMNVPDYNGFSLFLPLVYTPTGLLFDDSSIGQIHLDTLGNTAPPPSFLPCDDKQYITASYSADGIPYARLGNKWFNQTTLLPKFSGKDFATQYKSGTSTSTGFLHNNTAGSVTATADTGATGFTFTTINTGASPILMNTYWCSQSHGDLTGGSIYILLETQFPGTPAAAQPPVGPPVPAGFDANAVRNGSPLSIQYSRVDMVDAAALATAPATPAFYWTFSTIDAVAVTTDYYVWYLVNGETDPAPGGIGIEVKLDPTDTDSMATQKTVWAINQFQVTKIAYKAASTVPQNAYFTFTARRRPTLTKDYYVWYSKDGVTGTDPAPGGTGINVQITTGDTAASVNLSTQAFINKYAFGVPNLKGFFLRGTDPLSIVDQGLRFSSSDGTFTGVPGTFEYDDLLQHLHPTSLEAYTAGSAKSISQSNTTNTNNTLANTHNTGIYENRPKNFAIQYLVKY